VVLDHWTATREYTKGGELMQITTGNVVRKIMISKSA